MKCFTKEPNAPHFVLVPLAAQGHLIPMVDIGRLLAEHGVRVSLIITPANAARIKPMIDRAKDSNLPIHFVEIAFPDEKFGLPSGCESVELVSDFAHYRPFFDAIYSLDKPLEEFLGTLERLPDCIITDMCNAWTAPVARKFGVKRVIFHGPCCFYISADYNLTHNKVYECVTDENEYVTVPDFPVELKVTKAQTPGFLSSERFKDMREKCIQEELTADGVVINTFLELERPFIENHKRVTGKSVWSIGPICLYNKDVIMRSGRGHKEAIEQTRRVLTWLDNHKRDPRSVLYANFGSVAYTNPLQLIEIGSALESSHVPFIWAIKRNELKPEISEWLSGFEERTKESGLIIIGWAPQMDILSHAAVGGFVTHCGWNSMLEAISTGIPMITWPRFADQFVNENLVVDVLGIGVSLGVKVPSIIIGTEEVRVERDELAKGIIELMDGGIEGKERRERSKGLAEKAKKAMQEGGSSYRDLTDFIHCFTYTA